MKYIDLHMILGQSVERKQPLKDNKVLGLVAVVLL